MNVERFSPARPAVVRTGIPALIGHGRFVPVVSLISWIYLYLAGMLGLWVVIVTLGAGWNPVVIVSGSMAPVLRPGDVVMIEDRPDELLGQRSVITFDRDGDIITHRVFEVLEEKEAYVTKGDANPTPDTDLVPAASVIGAARLVIPLIGLPAVWLGRADLVSLGAFAVLSLAAIGIAVRDLSSRKRRIKALLNERTSTLADQAVRRVRILIAVMITGQYAIDGSRFVIEAVNIGPAQLLALSLLWLAGTNVVSGRLDQVGESQWVGLFQLVADTLLVVLLTTATGGSGIGWVLTALPIVEAAVRYRLAGALVHWMLMAVLTILGRVWILNSIDSPSNQLIGELEQLLDQMSVLLLVVIPGAFLAEQLLGDVILQRRATVDAVARGRLLENVAELGFEVTRIGTALFETLTKSAASLGFDVVDAWARTPTGGWTRIEVSEELYARHLPQPGQPASGLRMVDLPHPEVLVDGSDGDGQEVEGLFEAGLDALVRITLSTDETLIVLRGANFVGRPFDAGPVEALRLLCGQATVALQNRDLVNELKDLHSELEHQALHDALTRLPNRAYFLRELSRELEPEAMAERGPDDMMAVLFLDLNGFKPVNDTLGHDAGDELLKVVATRLQTVADSFGLVARLGGDEFTVLLPRCRGGDASNVASAIHAALAEPIELDQDTVVVGASIGIAFHEDGVDSSEWLRRADAAMYAAKQSSSSRRVSYYHADLDLAEPRRGRLVGEFKRALEHDGLDLVFQPLVSTVGHRIMGAEVLLRWNHPELGALGPGMALQMAEQADLVSELNGWIVHTALGEMSRWPISGERPFTLAINASPAELSSPTLIPNLGDALLLTGVRPSQVVVELSERIVASGDDLEQVVTELVRLGVGLSLDDFGEGRTSLGHLRRLPIRQLKLDRMLVHQACTSDSDRIILNSVVELGHNLGFEVVAEGVETEGHKTAVMAAGADLLQGYGLYRPMTSAELADLLARENIARSARPPIPPAPEAKLAAASTVSPH